MKKKKYKKEKMTLDEYIGVAKTDIYVYAFLAIVMFLILLTYPMKWYYRIFFDGVLILRTIEMIETYFCLKKIKKYLIENNLLDKIGIIDFWNEHYYFLTENYIIIFQNNRVNVFPYSEIKEIYKEYSFEGSRHARQEENLYIITDNSTYKILVWTSTLVVDKFKDISQYLVQKNPAIKIGKSVKKRNSKIISER